MGEVQVHDIIIKKQDLSGFDTGGGTRRVEAVIQVDSSLPTMRQREALIHEVLGVYLGIMISTEDITEIAGSLNEAICKWEDA